MESGEQSQLYSVVINKATRAPYLVKSGLSFIEARDLATLMYKHWSVFYEAQVAYPVVRMIVVCDGDHLTFTEKTVVYRCGAV